MKAIYKCRLCGAVYHNGSYAGKKIANRLMVEMNIGLVSTQPMATTMTETHDCGGAYTGSLGLADFQGWVAEENEDGTKT